MARAFVIAALVVGHLWLACPAFAQGCEVPRPLPPEDAIIHFDALLVRGCFGQEMPSGEVGCFGWQPECDAGADCIPSVCQQIDTWRSCWNPDLDCEPAACGAELCERRETLSRAQVQEELVREAAPLFAEVRELASTLPPDGAGSDRLLRQLRAWEGLLTEGDPGRLPTEVWGRDGLTLFSDDDTVSASAPGLREIDTEAILTGVCAPGGAEAECSATFEQLGKVWTLALSQQTMLRTLQREHRVATVRYLDILDQRWRAYLLGGRSLFPWERWANGEFYRRSLDEERGFIEPPSRQYVFLHPTPAYEYRDYAEDGLEEVLSLEVAGFYRWRWRGSEMHRPWGGSLLVSWDGSDEDSVGYGVMAHLPRNWSLGVVARKRNSEQEWAVLLSADLAKLVVNTAQLRERLKNLRLGGD